MYKNLNDLESNDHMKMVKEKMLELRSNDDEI